MMRTWILAGAVLILAAVAGSPAQAFSKDSLVYKKCTDCHAVKDGKISRVEEIRTTPEEWWVIVDRMERLYGMELAAGEMEQLLKELCATQILTPEEQAKVYYLSLQHNSQFMEIPDGPDQEHLFTNCVRCHTAGKIYSYRMTPKAWAKVRDFHHYVTPTVHLQMRELRWRPEADKALAYLGKNYPYGQAWKAPDYKIDGSWVLVGREPGKGDYRGRATLEAAGGGEYRLKGTLAYADGTSESFTGDATLYGGYALRTRTQHNGFATRGAYTFFSAGEARGENHFEAPRFRTSASRWVRDDGVARVLRVSPGFVLAGEETTVTIEGMNLPEVQEGGVAFTGGVEVLSAARTGRDTITARVRYSGKTLADADLTVKGAESAGVALKAAPKVDRIAVVPGTGRARLAAGPHYPAEGVQFEAMAYAEGDVALGPVPAAFRVEEESTRHDDDDLQWVGGIGPNGSYVPIGDYAPVPSRRYSGEASGWVKVVARYEGGGTPLEAEAHLAVTMPDFIPRIR
ncbi:MAG: hypothetical protein AB1578_10755 [Thermodesulfobacteriota bacterium]